MRVVLDTNVLLQIISSRSKHHWIWEAFREERLILCLTTEILLEYEELLLRKRNQELARLVLEVLLLMPNMIRVETYFNFGLPVSDPDDQKFVDCAIACGARYLITEDKSFQELNDTPFPVVQVLGPNEFKQAFQQ